MRLKESLLLATLICLFACKNDPAPIAPQAPESTAVAPVGPIDTIVVSLRAIDFYEVTKVKPNLAIIDVRPAEEFKTGHLNRAVNIPETDANYMNRIASLSRTQEYGVYCAAGTNSMELAEKMRNLGFKRIYHLKGGLTFWAEAQQALQIN